MGESACLVRSFSQPADTSREAYEGDPIRALTESISFGRFMSESLAWEKWSTFSHNCYLEEVEKFSKPGSVAQKKAYFEAHYKKRAAMKAAAMLDKGNAVTNDVPEMETSKEIQRDSFVDAKSAKTNIHLAVNEQEQKDLPNTEVTYSTDANACNSTFDGDKINMAEGGEAEVEQNVNVESSSFVESSEQLENPVNHEEVGTPEEKIPNKHDQGNMTSSSKPRQSNSSSRSSTKSGASELMLSHDRRATAVQARNGSDAASNSKKSSRDLNDKRKSRPKSLHMSISFGSCAGGTNKTSLKIAKDSLTSQRATSMQAKNINNAAPYTNKFTGDSNTKKRSIPNCLHMSINFAFHAGETSKTSCKMPTNSSTTRQATSVHAKNENNVPPKRVISTGDSYNKKRSMQTSLHMSINLASRGGETSKSSLRMPIDVSNPTRTSIRASVTGVSKHPLKNLHSEDKRSNTLVNKAVSGGIKIDGKWQSSTEEERLPKFSKSCVKSLNSSGGKARSSITSTPFSFRSDERAAKRRGFFKKLEDKNNTKEVEKEEMPIRSKVSALQLPPIRPRSPKLGRKSSHSSILGTSSQPPRRPSVNTGSCNRVREKNNQSTTLLSTSLSKKNVHEKNNQSSTCPSTSLSKKNAHENASPNIQR